LILFNSRDFSVGIAVNKLNIHAIMNTTNIWLHTCFKIKVKVVSVNKSKIKSMKQNDIITKYELNLKTTFFKSLSYGRALY